MGEGSYRSSVAVSRYPSIRRSADGARCSDEGSRDFISSVGHEKGHCCSTFICLVIAECDHLTFTIILCQDVYRWVNVVKRDSHYFAARLQPIKTGTTESALAVIDYGYRITGHDFLRGRPSFNDL